ncbi:hypothetical protein CLOM_g20725 [Closterium sp. NIES-68]|nr:hypothetical protein CLOM_g20725 [Closterium sp. NIES-68]
MRTGSSLAISGAEEQASPARLACWEAQKACSPVWIDEARSRIRQAALAVLEAQQQSQHLASMVDDKMLLDEPRWTEHLTVFDEWSRLENVDQMLELNEEEATDDDDSLTAEPQLGQGRVFRPSDSFRGAIVNFVRSSLHLIM